jgi:hypothetical protein
LTVSYNCFFIKELKRPFHGHPCPIAVAFDCRLEHRRHTRGQYLC